MTAKTCLNNQHKTTADELACAPVHPASHLAVALLSAACVAVSILSSLEGARPSAAGIGLIFCLAFGVAGLALWSRLLADRQQRNLRIKLASKGHASLGFCADEPDSAMQWQPLSLAAGIIGLRTIHLIVQISGIPKRLRFSRSKLSEYQWRRLTRWVHCEAATRPFGHAQQATGRVAYRKTDTTV